MNERIAIAIASVIGDTPFHFFCDDPNDPDHEHVVLSAEVKTGAAVLDRLCVHLVSLARSLDCKVVIVVETPEGQIDTLSTLSNEQDEQLLMKALTTKGNA